MWYPKVTHFRSDNILGVVGGFPECYAHARLLNMDATGYPMTRDKSEVTCKKCRKRLKLDEPQNM